MQVSELERQRERERERQRERERLGIMGWGRGECNYEVYHQIFDLHPETGAS